MDAPELDYAIHTTIVTDDGPKHGWLEILGDRIVKLGNDDEHPSAKHVLEFDGYAYPGLIDTHNHVDWNTVSRWSAGHDWDNRYQWQEDDGYKSDVNSPHSDGISKNKNCIDSCKIEATEYGELRALTGGTTMIQSSFDNTFPQDLVIRQLGPNYKADAWTLNVGRIPDAFHESLLDGLKTGRLDRAFFHVAEGKREDSETESEFDTLRKDGFVRPGTVVIHGLGLDKTNFDEMKKNGMYLVWSPESNLNLYGETTDIKAAKEAGLTVALAPDWTITGSNNALEELNVASNYAKTNNLQNILTPKVLYNMVTSDAAEVAGVGNQLGHLAPNFGADVLLVQKHDSDPYNNLIQSNIGDVSLVFIKGKPLYGDESMLKPLAPNAESINIAGSHKALNTEATALKEPAAVLMDDLNKALPHLAPLHEGK